ncbi:uncharacterized protein LOC127136596 [Lathyrus oleraceus]|uniref:uncharacterized protein LOC127136596 n=1 Tax=Pisum sativum TaxID=3888 RepID=UPI0021D03B9B|nr:uncharacterized protein LOC127136596 [Pisum sativum]
MAAHVEDDKLMIHYFQDSFSGAPSKWYLSLDHSRIRCFQDLSDAFIKHYKYNMDMAPDRRQLQSMFQHDKESFKEYAQRWREMASQVEPPLAEKELAELFIDTVQPQFYEKMKGLVVPRPMGPPLDHFPPWDMGPNVKNNPLPSHGDPTVNAIEDSYDNVMVEKVDDVKTPLAAFHARLVEAGLIDVYHDSCEECATHLRGFQMVRDNIQDLMNKGVFQISSVVNNEDVLVIEPCFNLPELVEIPCYSRRVVPENSHLSPVEICMPTLFLYESTKVVPWRYEVTIVDKIVGGSADGEVTEAVNEDVTNIVGMSRMTHSGRIYTPEFNVTPQVLAKESIVIAPTKEPEAVQSEDVGEFLKLIKSSDYKVVDQLHQTPSKISILSLLLNSQAQREALLKVLAQAHVTQSIMVVQFGRVVVNITACNTLSFSGEELPEDGKNHNRALHISVKCKYDALVRVLVDTRSSLNVMPKRTLSKLSYQGPAMKLSALIVKAFDGSRRTVIGEVELPILIGPHIFPINFQIMDINSMYSYLLGRPWIHAIGAVTSTLHQKMKFVMDNQLIIIYGEEDFVVSHLSSFRYIEADEDALETSFQTLEIANATFVEMKDPIGKSCSSFASLKSVKSNIEGGNLEGWGQLIDVREKHDRFGLGYVPSAAKGA